MAGDASDIGETRGQLSSPDPLTADCDTCRHVSSHTKTVDVPNTLQAAVNPDEEGWDMDGEFEMEDCEFAPGYMAYGTKDEQYNPGGILNGPTAFEDSNSNPTEDLRLGSGHIQNNNMNNNLHSPAALETSNPGTSLDLESESAPVIVETPKSAKTLEMEYRITPTVTAKIADASIHIQPSRRAEGLEVEENLAVDLDSGFNQGPSTSMNSAPSASVSRLSAEYVSSDSSNDSGSDSDISLDAYERCMKTQTRAAESEAAAAASSRSSSSTPPSSKPKTRKTRTAAAATTTPPPPTARHPGIAAHKRALPPTGPLDPTDTLIFTLKTSGHSDRAVAAALVARGLHAYDPKSISTRHRRIREARAAETDRALRLRRRRWTAAEDEALVEAYLGALRRQDDEVRKLRRRFYKDVAGAVGERVMGSFFSAAACEERYRDLMAGRAVVEREWGDVEVERREGVKRLTAFWKQECERARREDGEWQDNLVKEVAEEEKERRKEERARRGGTAREVRAERKAERRGGGRARGSGARFGRGRGKGRGGKSPAA